MQKKPTTPPKKPTTNASSESRLEPSKLRFKPIRALTPIQTQPTDPPSSKPKTSTVVKTHTSKATHHQCLVRITIGAIGALTPTQLIPPLRKPRGLGSKESRKQMRKREGREKRREIMRKEREIPGLKRGERAFKN